MTTDEKRELIKSSVYELGTYFRRKITDLIANKYADALIDYEIDDLKAAFKHYLNEGEKMPLIKHFKGLLVGKKTSRHRMFYDPDYDDRFPVELMNVGYRILCKSGYEDFERFANNQFMPKSDRDRILCKYKRSHNAEAVAAGLSDACNAR
jgi:hypothetical protein